MWVAEDKFVFAPDPRNPLTFMRKNNTQIKPGIMYTDGGSIPKIVQPITGFSPWGYAPAYMIHDWIFTARHCIVDGLKDSRYDDVAKIKFNESALILAEVIKTLVVAKQVPKNDFAMFAISNAVDSPVAKSLWDIAGECKKNIVDPKHAEQVRAAFGIGRILPNASKALPVARFNFDSTTTP